MDLLSKEIKSILFRQTVAKVSENDFSHHWQAFYWCSQQWSGWRNIVYSWLKCILISCYAQMFLFLDRIFIPKPKSTLFLKIEFLKFSLYCFFYIGKMNMSSYLYNWPDDKMNGLNEFTVILIQKLIPG